MTARHRLASNGEIPADIGADAYPSVVAMAEQDMANYADKAAFVGTGHALRYAEIDVFSREFCAWLQCEGIAKSYRVPSSPKLIGPKSSLPRSRTAQDK